MPIYSICSTDIDEATIHLSVNCMHSYNAKILYTTHDRSLHILRVK